MRLLGEIAVLFGTLGVYKLCILAVGRPVARGGSGGSEEPPSWEKGPQFQ